MLIKQLKKNKNKNKNKKNVGAIRKVHVLQSANGQCNSVRTACWVGGTQWQAALGFPR
jgi:endonuclease I